VRSRHKQATIQRIADEARAKKEAAANARDRALHVVVAGYVEAKGYVKIRLKAPATAHFASYSDSPVINKGDGTYIVVSYVAGHVRHEDSHSLWLHDIHGGWANFVLAGLET
jgi:hypothetical protein